MDHCYTDLFHRVLIVLLYVSNFIVSDAEFSGQRDPIRLQVLGYVCQPQLSLRYLLLTYRSQTHMHTQSINGITANISIICPSAGLSLSLTHTFLQVMEVVVTTGAIRHAKLQSNYHHQQTNTQLFRGRMSFV